MNNSDPLIKMQSVFKTFRNAAGEFVALKGIDASVYEGEFVGVIGKSGSGKSTMINMITGIDRPSRGEIIVAGTNVHTMNESDRAIWRGKNLGIVFQFFQLLPMLSLLENTMLPMDFCNMYAPSEREPRALSLLRQVGLEDQAYKLPAAVSGGQQQSAAIARALANDPPIIIADEPTGNLDSRSAEIIYQMFEELASSGKTIVMITHDSSLIQRMSRYVLLSDGEIIDEAVARSLPWLPHTHMLRATHMIERKSYQSGAMILSQGESNDQFFMISSGKVEVVMQSRRGGELIVSQLAAGEFFGEIELMRGGKTVASIRATDDAPVEVVVLTRQQFTQLLSDSPVTEEAISEIVNERLQEHRIAERRKRR